MDYFDLARQYKNKLANAFLNHKTKYLVVSFTSDWLYPTKQSKEIVIAMNSAGANVAFSEIKTDKGHDAFLLEEPNFLKTIKDFINTNYEYLRNDTGI